MATKITDTEMTSDLTPHTATAWSAPDEPMLWSVTWLPGRALTRDQAVTAMTIAEMVVERADILADSSSKLWWHMDGWAAELGLTGPHAVAEASLSPEDHADMPRVVTTEFDSRPGRRGYLLELDRSTGMAKVRIDGGTVTMFAAHLQYADGPGDEGDEEEPMWTRDEDGAHWRAQLPDGRTAVIERLADAGENGEGASFLPKVYESCGDFETGPVCAGLLDAAAWVAELADCGPEFAAELAARVEATK
jgi:hypothetical protein